MGDFRGVEDAGRGKGERRRGDQCGGISPRAQVHEWGRAEQEGGQKFKDSKIPGFSKNKNTGWVSRASPLDMRGEFGVFSAGFF